MEIRTLINRIDTVEKQSIFESIGHGDQYFRTWEKEIHPVLCEVALSPNQIQGLFKSIETGAGRSALGKFGDTVKGAWFDKFGGMLQSSAPVQAFDQKWEDIKSKIAAKHPDLAARLAKYGEFAKSNPNLHKFLLGIAGSAAAALGVAVAGGVGAGALAVGTGTGVAVGILNIADRLLQGQKASTAIGRGATAGLVAGLTAGAVAKAKEVLRQLGAVKTIHQASLLDINGDKFYLKPEDAAKYKHAVDAVMKATTSLTDLNKLGSVMDAADASYAKAVADILSRAADPAYQEAAYKLAHSVTTISPGIIGQAANAVSSALTAVNPVLSAVAGQSAASAGEKKPFAESLTKQQINELFGITGNKVDASTLEKAWKKAGSPTDSDEIAKILQGAGVSAEVIAKIYTDLKIPPPAANTDNTGSSTGNTATGITVDNLFARISKLTPQDKQKVIAALQG
jgi:hypothetical protein